MSKLIRVTHQHRCPVCNKPDWCLFNHEIAICMRVQSTKEHTFANSAVGWIHEIEPGRRSEFRTPPKQEKPPLDAKAFMLGLPPDPSPLEYGKELGVHYDHLARLGCRYSHYYKAWAFPMRGGDGEFKGVRLRNSQGRKWAVPGSREGVFYSFLKPESDTLYVVEGPTDTAAAMTLGLDCVGRPSCYGGIDEVRVIVRNQKFKRVVIVSDNDDVGRRGAKAMLAALWVSRCILTLPAKDMREFVNNGGRKPVLEYMLRNIVWTKPMKGNT